MFRWIYAHELRHLWRPEEGGSPGVGVRGSCYEPLASGAGPLQDQYMFLAAKLSLQPLVGCFPNVLIPLLS